MGESLECCPYCNQLEADNNNAKFILELCQCINVVRIPKGKVATLDDNN